MADVIVRDMRREDTPVWRDMRARLYGEDPSLLPEIEEFFSSPSPIAAAFMAVLGRPLGFIELGVRNYAEGCITSPVAYVEGLFVENEHRHSGIGRALIETGEAWAKAQGYTELASDALIDNAVSIAAHEAYGFAEVERIVCFRKTLA